MGQILSTKNKKDKVILEVELDYEESLQLKGHTKKVHVFSEECADIQTNLSARGKNEATKYFLVPRQLRSDLRFKDKVQCQKLETESKIIFVYVVDRIRL